MISTTSVFATTLGSVYCCNLSSGVALIVWFTTNGMCAKNNNTYMWREQATIEWSWRVSFADINVWTIELDD